MAPISDWFNSLRTLFTTTPQGWTAAGAAPTAVVANGNRSYSLSWASSILPTKQPGMRNKYTRTATAPTQSTSLNGTTQYYSKSSPNGMTFTDDFTISAWVKLTSYAAVAIASRWDGTSGWIFSLDSSGRVQLVGLNAGAGNNSLVLSYQSLPLNKWVHVAAQLDMSAFTATTTTSYVMIDGVDVPASVTRSGTNPTTLAQGTGALQIGAQNGGNFFPGKIAQAAIYSAKVTQATIKASMNQTLSGSETSLISAYSFSNSIADLNTTNANNLTASGSAVATNADTPFTQTVSGITAGTTNYSITTAISSDGLTETVQVPEGDTLPTTGGISAVSYSTQKVPYGFPADKGKWTVMCKYKTPIRTTINTTTAQLTGYQITIPVGAWQIRNKLYVEMRTSGTAFSNTIVGLSTAPTSFSADLEDSKQQTVNTNVSISEIATPIFAALDYAITSQTIVYGVAYTSVNGTVDYGNSSQSAPTLVTADCSYL